MSDTRLRDQGLISLFSKFQQTINGETTFDSFIPITLPQVSQYENFRIRELRWVKNIEKSIFRLIKEKNYLEAGFSYLDAIMVVPYSSGRCTCLLLAANCFYYQQKETLIFEESFSLFMLICFVTQIYLIISSSDPTFELNQLQIFLSTLSASSKLLPITKHRMALINQILQENEQIHYESMTFYEIDQINDLIDTLITCMCSLSKITPIMETFNVTLWDSLFIHHKTSQMTECYIKKMKSSQDIILSQLLADYYLFEGTCKGWIDQVDFEKYRKTLMQSLLEQKGYSAIDVYKNLLQNSVLKRSEDDWLLPLPELANLDPINKYENIQGVELNFKTGEIDFITIKGEFPVIDNNDINEVNQKGLYDTFFSLDQPDPQFRFHPFQQMRYGPDRLQDTRFLSTMLHADYLLKMLLTGVEVNPKPHFKFQPAQEGFLKRLPEFIQKPLREVLEKMLFSQKQPHRFWIEGGNIEYSYTQKGEILQFSIGEVKMKVKKHLLRRDADGNLVDHQDDEDDSPEAQFAYLFSEFYDLIGAYFPELLRLKELYKLACISRFINRIRSAIIKNIEECKTELQNELLKYLDEARNLYSKTHFLKQSISNIEKQFTNQFPSLQGQQLNEDIKLWLVSGNSPLLQKLVDAAIDKKYGNILKSLQNSYFYQQEESFSLSSDINKCNWVPAAFCCANNARFIYGGVSMAIKCQERNVPGWVLNIPRCVFNSNLVGAKIAVDVIQHLTAERPKFFSNPETLKDQVEKVYVIRRPLLVPPMTNGILAHSGLLIKSKEKDTYTIVEYMGDGKVYNRQLTLSQSDVTNFKEGWRVWNKQEKGVIPQNNITVGDIQKQMEKNMSDSKYNFFYHNCHIAQESTRLSLGLVDENKLNFPKEAHEQKREKQKN